MSHITTVSLCPDSAPLASRMKREGKNFSRFVRECLFVYYAEAQEDCTDDSPWIVKHPEGEISLCRPSRRYPCRKCWPTGIPDAGDWAKARSHVRMNAAWRSPHMELEIGYKDNLIPELTGRNDEGLFTFEDEKVVVEWLRGRALEVNRFIMPLQEIELEGNAKPRSKPKPKSLIRRALNFLQK